MQMSALKIRSLKINHIFISHLHGDHYFGLIGLLTTMGLNGRKNELNIYSPTLLKDIIELQFKAADAHLPYHLHFHELKNEEELFQDKNITIRCFRVNHRIECWGFFFREKRNKRHIDPRKVSAYNIPSAAFEKLQNGENYISREDEEIKNELLTTEGEHAASYAYCADTGYFEPIAEKIKDVDLVYHESTYLKDLAEKASSRFHSTSIEAAMIAKKANAKKLLLGHFSSMYESIEEFEKEASEIFENTECAREGVCYLV